MKREHVIQLAELLGLKYGSTRGKNILIQCPLAPYSAAHAHSVDEKPSWSVLIDEEGPSVCNCFGCGKKGSLLGFFARATRDSTDFEAALAFVREHEIKLSLRQTFDKAMRGRKKDEPQPFALSSFIRACATTTPDYVIERGITEQEVGAWMVGYDPFDHRAVFPLWDMSGAMVGAVGRAIDDEDDAPKYLNYEGQASRIHFYG